MKTQPSMFNPRNSSKNAPTQTFGTGQSKYINEPHFQNVTRMPIPLFSPNTAARKAVLDQNTQIFERDRDLFLQTTIPLSQRIASLANISSPGDYNCKPVKEFHTSTLIQNLWNVTEQVLDTGKNKYEQEKISQLQYKIKLVEPKLILKEAKVKKLPEKANEDIEMRSLSQPKSSLSSVNKSNEGSLKRLAENDLRFVLQSKRLKSVDICYEKQEREKKRVTFNLQNYDDDGYSVPNNEETVSFKASIPIQLLKESTKIHTNNEWYISVDEYVLLEDFDFIMDYVATDKSCRLLIPDSIVMYIEELASGEHRGRSYVMQARHVHRRLGDFGYVQVVETEDGASVVGDLIKCCFAKMDMGNHVVLITKIKKLEDSAKSFGVHVYNLDYIKNGTKPLMYDERNTGNNLLLQNEEDFDPFVLSKTAHTVNSSKNIAFHDSDSTLFDYDKDYLNHANQENTVDLCQNLEKLNLNDNLSKTNLTTTSISNDKYTNNGENIWKVQNEKQNLKKHEHSDTVEDKLRRFEVKDTTIENNIVLRLEEWICCFVQIMEELINLVLQKNVDTKDQIPFSLRDGLVHLKDLYLSTKEVNVIIEKLLALCRFCPMKGNLNNDIEPNDFLKILGCGFLLVDCLEGVISEYLSDIKGLLATLLENIQTCHTHEDPVEVETPLHPSEIDEDNDVRDSTADSDLENENHACTFINHFLAEVSRNLITMHTFLTKCVTDLRNDKMTDETKKGLLDKTKQTRIQLGVIMQKLKAIIERESRLDSALKSKLLKGGSDVAEDRRMTNYRQTMIKLLEQVQILESSLKILINFENDAGDRSCSSTTETNHFNIFE